MRNAGKYFVAIASAVGFVGFLLLFVATFAAQPALEDAMNGFVRSRVHQEVRERFGSAAGADATQLGRFIHDKYIDLVHALMSEIRLFSGVNTALFAAVLALLFARWREPAVVLVPAALLLAATAVCIAVYVFGQNWFFSIFLQDYAGYGYLAYVSVVFAFLLDIAFNRGRMTRGVLNVFTAPVAS